MADQDIDELQRAADERIEIAREAEKQLLEQLDHRGLVELWKTVRKRLHCEKFFLSPTGLAMTDQLMKTITNAQMQWLLAGDPTAPAVLDAHRHAQAAQLALYSIDKIMGDGKQALVELERIQREMGSDD